jgi:hypothetical protein
MSSGELAELAVQLDERLQDHPERLPFDLLPGHDQPLRRSRSAAVMLEIASAMRGFDPVWLKERMESPELAIARADQRQLLRNLFFDRVEKRFPVQWDEFQNFGFTSEELELRAETDRVCLGREFDSEFRLEARVAIGGVAVVYRGRSLSDGSSIAVRIPRHDADDADDEFAQCLLDEAELLRQLSVEGVPRLLDLRHESFGPMLVMEWVETARGPGIPASAPLAERLQWLSMIARTLDQVHQKDLIHGDVKMENILIDLHGKAWLVDFNVTRNADPRLNRDAPLPGTRSMMSQEALVGVAADADISQDLYALGAVLYQTLTGMRLVNFSGREAALVASVLVGGVHAPEYPADVPEELKKIVQVATSRHVHLRFATASDFADAVDRFLGGTLTVAEIPAIRRGLHAWQAGTRLGLCMLRHRTLLQVATEFDAANQISAGQWRRIRTDVARGATAALAAEELEQLLSLLQWPLPPCPCIKALMTLFYSHTRLATGELPTVRSLAAQFGQWLRTTCQDMEAKVSHQDPRNYLLFVTAMEARLASASTTARTRWAEIAASAGLPADVIESFREFLARNPADGDAWTMAMQGLEFSVIRWLRWGVYSASHDQHLPKN